MQRHTETPITKIALTGGHGFIGSRVTRLLATRGDSLALLMREDSSAHRIADLAFTRIDGDVLEPDTLETAFAGADAVIHLACPSSWAAQRTDRLEQIIEEGTRNVITAAAACGAKRVVHVSSVAALGGSEHPDLLDETVLPVIDSRRLRYAAAKQRSEGLARVAARQLGVELVIVNPAETYGPGDDGLVTAGALLDILKSWPAVACRGGTSVVHVDDVAAGIVAALDRGRAGERYILGGENVSIERLVRITLEAAGVSRPVVIMPSGVLKRAVRLCTRLGLPAPIEAELAEYATRFWFVSSEKARRELGFTARPAEETLRETVKSLLPLPGRGEGRGEGRAQSQIATREVSAAASMLLR